MFPLLLPPLLIWSVPACTLTVPLLLKLLLKVWKEPHRLKASTPVPCLTKVPRLLKVPGPTKEQLVSEELELTVKVPLLLKVPPPKNSVADPVQLAAPSFSRTRSSSTPLTPLMLSAPPLAMMVLPAPLIVPAVQSNVPVTVTSPFPERVPPLR